MIYLIGGSTTLSANADGTITIKFGIGVQMHALGLKSTGRVKITNMEVETVEDFFDGEAELDALKNEAETFKLPEPLMIPKNSNLTISLTDISGATNTVNIVCIGRKV